MWHKCGMNEEVKIVAKCGMSLNKSISGKSRNERSTPGNSTQQDTRMNAEIRMQGVI